MGCFELQEMMNLTEGKRLRKQDTVKKETSQPRLFCVLCEELMKDIAEH